MPQPPGRAQVPSVCSTKYQGLPPASLAALNMFTGLTCMEPESGLPPVPLCCLVPPCCYPETGKLNAVLEMPTVHLIRPSLSPEPPQSLPPPCLHPSTCKSLPGRLIKCLPHLCPQVSTLTSLTPKHNVLSCKAILSPSCVASMHQSL